VTEYSSTTYVRDERGRCPDALGMLRKLEPLKVNVDVLTFSQYKSGSADHLRGNVGMPFEALTRININSDQMIQSRTHNHCWLL